MSSLHHSGRGKYPLQSSANAVLRIQNSLWKSVFFLMYKWIFLYSGFAITSCSFTEYHREDSVPCLLYCHLSDMIKPPLEPSLPQAEQSHLSQPPFIWQMLFSLKHLHSSSVKFMSFFCVEPRMGFQMCLINI